MSGITRDSLVTLASLAGCSDSACPAVQRVRGTDRYVVVGTVLSAADLAEIPGVGPGETAVGGLDIKTMRDAVAAYDAGIGNDAGIGD